MKIKKEKEKIIPHRKSKLQVQYKQKEEQLLNQIQDQCLVLRRGKGIE